jgi:hypothetical protein
MARSDFAAVPGSGVANLLLVLSATIAAKAGDIATV